MTPTDIPHWLTETIEHVVTPALVAVKGALVRPPQNARHKSAPAPRHMAPPKKPALERLDDLIARAFEIRASLA